jgi:hypothetical protein
MRSELSDGNRLDKDVLVSGCSGPEQFAEQTLGYETRRLVVKPVALPNLTA